MVKVMGNFPGGRPKGTARKGRRDAVAASGLVKMLAIRDHEDRLTRFGRVVVRAAVPVAIGYLVLAATFGVLWGLVYGAGVLGALWLWRVGLNNRAALTAIGSLLVLLLVLFVVVPDAAGTPGVVPPGVGLAAAIAIPGAFMSWRHHGSRAVTVMVAHVGCLVAGLLSLLSPEWGGALAVVWVLGVLVWRTGAVLVWQVAVAKTRSRIAGSGVHHRRRRGGEVAPSRVKFTDDNVQRGIEAEQTTAASLADLPEQWSVLHSRSIPGTNADVDHLAIGPAGVFVLDSKNWAGRVTRSRSLNDDGVENVTFLLNGSAQTLADRLQSTAFEARRVMETLNVPQSAVRIVVVFNDRMKLPADVVEVTLYDAGDEGSGYWDPVVHLVQERVLTAWMLGLPEHMWGRRGVLRRAVESARRIPGDVAAREATDRYLYDLGVVADYAMPPK